MNLLYISGCWKLDSFLGFNLCRIIDYISDFSIKFNNIYIVLQILKFPCKIMEKERNIKIKWKEMYQMRQNQYVILQKQDS